MPRKGRDWGTCPRCGRKISWLEKQEKGGQVYYVAAHYLGRDPNTGKKIVEKCYLGPEEYDYVTRTHRGIVFQGAKVDVEDPSARLSYYLDAIISTLPLVRLEPEKALMLAREFKQIGEQLERLAREGEREGEGSQGDDD